MERSTPSPAWEELLAHADFLRALARGILRDEARAEDVVQDALIAAARRPPLRRASTRAFLARAVRRLAANAGRGERRRSERELAAARPEAEPSSAELAARIEWQRALFEAVLALPEPYRGAVYLRFYEGLPPRAIARRRGQPTKTVKTQLARGLERIRRRLDERSRGDRGAWTAALLPWARPESAAAAPLVIGGVLVTKKLVLAALVVLGAALAWRWASGPGAAHSPSTRRGAAPGALVGPTAEPAPAARELPEAERSLELAPERVAAQPAPATGALEVELVWEADGRPAAGIALDARCAEDPAPREEHFSATSDAEGIARFASLFAGEVSLELALGPSLEAVVAAGETTRVRYAIPPGDEVAGAVVDPAGEPVPGAELWVEGRPRLTPCARRVGTSGADGRFRLRGLAEEAKLGARAAGFQASALLEVGALRADGAGVRTVRLVLGGPGGGVRGRVLDPEGAPLAGALVQIGERGGHIVDLPDGARGEAARPAPVRTDARGEFEAPGGLAAGWQPVHAIARGFPELATRVEVRAGETVELELRLERPASIVGRLVDAEGEPVPGARVVAAEQVGGGWTFLAFPAPSARTDEAGRFELGWVAPGRRELNASDWRRPRLGRARATVECRAGERTTCELAMELGRTIAGRVVDGEGAPLAGWSVRGEPFQMGSVYPRQDTTDAAGRFLLANLGDCPFRLAVSAPGDFPFPPRAELAEVEPGSAGLEIVVRDVERAQGRVAGRVVDADGSVPRDVDLVLYEEGSDVGGFVDLDPRTGAFDHGPRAVGRYTLRVSRGGREVARSAPFEIEADARAEVGTIRIEEGGTVELVLRGIPAAELGSLGPTLDGEGYGTEHLELRGDRFVSGALAPGERVLRLRDAPWCVRDALVEIVSGRTTRVELAAERGFELTIPCSFEAPDEEWTELRLELTDARGELVSRRGPLRRARYDASRLAFRGLCLPPGTYRAEAWTDTGRRASELFTVDDPPRGERALQLVLR